MRLHMLIDSIKLFGFKDGLSTWFDFWVWSDIQAFWWEHFTRRHWCSEQGYHCKKKAADCKGKHWPRFPKKKNYPIHEGESCTYCGEKPAEHHIMNPNGLQDEHPWWKVCGFCTEVIDLQERLSTHSHAMMMPWMTPEGQERSEEEIKKILSRLKEIEKESGVPISVTTLSIMESGNIEASDMMRHD